MIYEAVKLCSQNCPVAKQHASFFLKCHKLTQVNPQVVLNYPRLIHIDVDECLMK